MALDDLVAFKTAADRLQVQGSGAWTADNADRLEACLNDARLTASPQLAIDMAGVKAFDTFGAWTLVRLMRAHGQPERPSLLNLPERFQSLYDDVAQTHLGDASPTIRRAWPLARLADVGRSVEAAGASALQLLVMTGAFVLLFARALAAPRRFRFPSIVHKIDQVGLQAMPIVVLITLLIGAIIAQQGYYYFAKFGASDYVVDLVGVLTLRELGVLIVAIMVAGRSGSSYTAELGSMNMRKEVDALRTMGRDPLEVLVLPRLIAILISLPLLTVLGSLAALVGGGIVAALYGMEPVLYVARLKEAVSIKDFEVGLIKAPFMALAIGVVACTEGFLVRGSSESLGEHTTSAVVKAIFLVIVLDGFFAMFFSLIDM